MLHPLRFTFLAFIFSPSFAAAADWQQFRGPDGNGHAEAKNLPLEWGPEKNVAWRTEVPGKGWSSPSLSQGRIYLTSAVPVEEGSASGDLDLAVLCYDAASGKQLWSKPIFRQDAKTAPAIHRKNSHASPTPLVDGSRIFVHFGHQGTACVTTDGEIIWKNQTLKYPPVHGNGG